jgi:F-type H+-transporting ATPase subunit a
MMGKKAAKFFLPLIGTCAFMIFFSNVFGLVPGFQPPTANLNTTMAMALVIFFATHIFGVKENGLGYFKHFLGPFLPLAPLMLPIELISHIARPLTLAVRLMANMTADHLVLGIFLTLGPWLVPSRSPSTSSAASSWWFRPWSSACCPRSTSPWPSRTTTEPSLPNPNTQILLSS